MGIKSNKYVIACAIFASLNSVLLGYDVGVMSGAIIFIQEDLKITEVQEVLVGCLSIASLFGSLAGGRTSDAIGRKWTMGLFYGQKQPGVLSAWVCPNLHVMDIFRDIGPQKNFTCQQSEEKDAIRSLDLLQRSVEVFNMDGRRFISVVVPSQRLESITQVVMNLPNDAAEYLGQQFCQR